MKRLVFLLLIITLGLFALGSCTGDGSDGGSGDNSGGGSSDSGGGDSGDSSGDSGSNEKYTVTLKVSEGVTVLTKNPVEVKSGFGASFQVSLGDTVAFRSLSAGSYNPTTRKITLQNVTADTVIDFVCEDVGYSTLYSYNYEMHGTRYDTSSVENGMTGAGTLITVTAGLASREFLGWTAGGEASSDNPYISTDRSFTFDLSPDMVDENGRLFLYANYLDENVYYYNANGGSINTASASISDKDYYTATRSGDVLRVELREDYYSQVGVASLFWDDGSFGRDGYILTEYNTEPDGSGEGYSLGSKFPLNIEARMLYCIWSECTEASEFEYTELTLPLPSGVSADKAPHWISEGALITSYTGTDSKVVIPDKLGGKPVIGIASGAFTDVTEMETLVMGRNILAIYDGAFVGCTSLKRIYYPDAVYYVSNDSFDEASFSGVTDFYVNATMAPRYSTADGSFALKFARLLSTSHKPRIIVLAGSSAFQGLSTEYLEALLDGEYAVVNFGTTRTTQGYIYLEAMKYYADSDDVILYAPENSIYMFGEPTLYWKTLRDLEGMYNLFRVIDASAYENLLGAFREYNTGEALDPDYPLYEANTSPRYKRIPQSYGDQTLRSNMNEYGEYQLEKRADYAEDMPEGTFKDVYEITLNEYVKSIKEGAFSTANPALEDWQTSEKWCKFTDARYKDNMNRAIEAAKESGAKVYFSFCPVDADEICTEAFPAIGEWISAYDRLILDTYSFDGNLGSSGDYIFAHQYFYDNAFHPNDYGRVWRTYRMYRDLAELFGIDNPHNFNSVGFNYEGCLFDPVVNGIPLYTVPWLEQ